MLLHNRQGGLFPQNGLHLPTSLISGRDITKCYFKFFTFLKPVIGMSENTFLSSSSQARMTCNSLNFYYITHLFFLLKEGRERCTCNNFCFIYFYFYSLFLIFKFCDFLHSNKTWLSERSPLLSRHEVLLVEYSLFTLFKDFTFSYDYQF